MQKPFVSPEQNLPELTFKAVFLAIILAVIFAASNAYLGLRVGLTVTASIPAAVIAMALFRFTKDSNILQNNLVQTGASASAAVATGIVFVIPALLIIHYWKNIDIWISTVVCLAGGFLGVLFSIPLRRSVLNNPELRFPEGRAIAEVLKVNQGNTSLKELFFGSLIGGTIQFLQQGFEVLAYSNELWLKFGSTIYGAGLGFDVSMLGAGYIVGFQVGLSIILGAVVGWVLAVPLFTHGSHDLPTTFLSTDYVMHLWSTKLRYIGIGTMLVGGLMSLLTSGKSIIESIRLSYQATFSKKNSQVQIIRTERDIPYGATIIAILLTSVFIVLYLMHQLFELQFQLGSIESKVIFFLVILLYLLVAGFIFSAISSYFSGLVGMSSSPISAVNIAAQISVCIILSLLLNIGSQYHNTPNIILHAAAIAILTTAFIASANCMSNNTIQDLKTGAILGATPWKLQTVLIIGVIASTLVVPAVVQLLFNAYGIAGIFPHPGMDPTKTLGAPQASLIAAVAQGVFLHNLPLKLISIGVIIAFVIIAINYLFIRNTDARISIVGFAIGMYLPMSMNLPLFIGGVAAKFVDLYWSKRTNIDSGAKDSAIQRSVLVACGLVAGGSIMGLLLSIPFAFFGNTDALSLVPANFLPYGTLLSIMGTFILCRWIYRTAIKV